MPRVRHTLALLLALLPLLSGGCSLFKAQSRGEMVRVQVENNLVVPTPITVYVVSAAGDRTLLGTVTAGSHSTLTFRSPVITGNYRFEVRVASQTRGDFLFSPYIALSGGEVVTWDVRANVVLLAR
jgi:hypothetical protein